MPPPCAARAVPCTAFALERAHPTGPRCSVQAWLRVSRGAAFACALRRLVVHGAGICMVSSNARGDGRGLVARAVADVLGVGLAAVCARGRWRVGDEDVVALGVEEGVLRGK